MYFRFALLFLFGFLCTSRCLSQETKVDPAKDKLIVETVMRMQSFEYQKASPKVVSAIDRFLAAQLGSDLFFSVIERFAVKGQTNALVAIALSDAEGKGNRAMQTLLNLDAVEALGGAMAENDIEEIDLLRLMRALTVSEHPKARKIVESTIKSEQPLRKREIAIEAMAASRTGEAALLDMVSTGMLPAELTTKAAETLSRSPDQKIREQSAQLLSLSDDSSDASALPAIDALVMKKGDSALGKKAYQRACFICHQIGEEGVAFGPALTEIGDKLPKDALYASILEPSAAISFGFEGFELTLKDGSFRIGIVASETDDVIIVRVPGGTDIPVEKSHISDRKPLKHSLMPENLHLTMSEEELVGLVEFLTTLRK